MRYNLRVTKSRRKRVRFWDHRNNLLTAALAMASSNQTIADPSDIQLDLIDIHSPPPCSRPPRSIHYHPPLDVQVLSAIGSPLGSSSRNLTPTPSLFPQVDPGAGQLTETPLGVGAGTALIDVQALNLLPIKPSRKHLQNRISIVAFELKAFERNCEDDVGWIGDLELNLARIEGSIVETRARCAEQNFVDEISQLDDLKTKFDAVAKAKRDKAGSPPPLIQIPHLPSTPVLNDSNNISIDNGVAEPVQARNISNVSHSSDSTLVRGDITSKFKSFRKAVLANEKVINDAIDKLRKEVGDISKDNIAMRGELKPIQDKIPTLESLIQNNHLENKSSLKELEDVIFKFISNDHERQQEFDKFKIHCQNSIDTLLKHVKDLKPAMQSSNETTLQGFTQGLGAGCQVNAPLDNTTIPSLASLCISSNTQTINTVRTASSILTPSTVVTSHHRNLSQTLPLPRCTGIGYQIPQPLGHYSNQTGYYQTYQGQSQGFNTYYNTGFQPTSFAMGYPSGQQTVSVTAWNNNNPQQSLLYTHLPTAHSFITPSIGSSAAIVPSVAPFVSFSSNVSSGQSPNVSSGPSPIVSSVASSVLSPTPTQDGGKSSRKKARESPTGSDTSEDSDDCMDLDYDNSELNDEAYDLKAQLKPSEFSDCNKAKIIQLHSNLPRIEAQYIQLQTRLDKYMSSDKVDIKNSVRKYVSEAVKMARKWCNNLVSRYNELDCGKPKLDKRLYDSLERFGANSEENVFEFLRKFELWLDNRGTDADKAELFWTQHLNEDIQDEIRPLKDDYSKMRRWLIEKMGDVKIMTRNILKPIQQLKIPTEDSLPLEKLNYYRKLEAGLQKIKELKQTPNMPLDDLAQHIHSPEFISQVVALLPNRTKDTFHDNLAFQGIYNAKGEDAFNALSRIISTHFLSCKNAECTTQNDNYNKGVVKSKKSAKDSKTDAFHGDTQETKKGSNKSKFKFPCPLSPEDKHSHELGKCSKFFSLKPRARGKEAVKHLCFSCLGPYKLCKKKCVNFETVKSAQLICPQCEDWAVQNAKSPRCMLFCTSASHTRLSDEDLIKALSGYLKDFDISMMKGKPIMHAEVNHVFAALNSPCTQCRKSNCSCKTVTKTRKKDPKCPVPTFDTSTGGKVNVSSDLIIEESPEDAFYVMQILRIGDKDVLVFFDWGANQHLIDGGLAEELNLCVMRETPINVGTAGGGSINSGYGRYAVNIGPDEEGYYHELLIQGMTEVTRPFPTYDLSDINHEVVNLDSAELNGLALPEYIGGSRVHMILGCKNTGLYPRLITTLDSGLGVFKSPFTDKFGSNIAYGGPHPTFTKNDDAHHISVYNACFSSMMKEYVHSPSTALAHSLKPELIKNGLGIFYEKDLDIDIDYAAQTDINPTAVSAEDLADMGIATYQNVEDPICICTDDDDFEPCVMSVHKARLPASKMKPYMDQEDLEISPKTRCDTCEACKCRFMSPREHMMSIQESVEQEAIVKSVTIDLENKKTICKYPFITDPVKALKKKHHGKSSNYYQAKRIFLAQCRKNAAIKNEMIKVKNDLVDREYIKKLKDLSPEQQKLIADAPFQHYNSWRSQAKPGSISTPYRMVVDGTCSGLNMILAKGVNNLGKTTDILLRNRCVTYAWSSDIKKMYNNLHLHDSALPYGLLLFSDDLDPNVEPDTYVMLRAWYGITPVGNQGGEAIERLATLQKDEYPAAFIVLTNNRFVDDLLGGSNKIEERDTQVSESEYVLGNGGFSLKYVVRSGEDPCEEASNDGKTVSVLGYNWATKEDILRPTFKEINFNKKSRGEKNSNPFPVVSRDDVRKLLDSTKITRRLIISKIAEIYDPVGIWEPYKLNLKLDCKLLQGQEWDAILPNDLQEHWTKRFQEFLEVPSMIARRAVVPIDAVDPSKIRLICLSDAGEYAGGCAIYASYLLKDGSYSSQLLTAKSRLMNFSIPRNELMAIKLMTDFAVSVKDALFQFETEFVFATDSTICMCWIHNLNKKLRMYTRNRAAEIRRSIQYVSGCDPDEPLPLYHISGKDNLADLVTKPMKISPSDLGVDSEWQRGSDWMRFSVSEMPFTLFSEIKLSKEEDDFVQVECFPEMIYTGHPSPSDAAHFVNTSSNTSHCGGCSSKPLTSWQVCYGPLYESGHCKNCKCKDNLDCHAVTSLKKPGSTLIDIVYYGWLRSLRILSSIARKFGTWWHKVHTKRGEERNEKCTLCIANDESHGDKFERGKYFRRLAKDHLFREESKRLKSVLSKKRLSKYTELKGILYAEGRISDNTSFDTQDLDFKVFFDSPEINSILPVVSSTSELFFIFVQHIHRNVRIHSGVEVTLREVFKTMMPIDRPKALIQSIRQDCSRCRLVSKKTLDLKIANHPAARTTLCPPFYYVQIDTVYGFVGQVYKNARKTFKLYALMIVSSN